MSESALSVERDQRSDFELREIFVAAYALVEPYQDTDGAWLSFAHESLAQEALLDKFPSLGGMRLFGVLGTISAVRASGRRPSD